MTVEKYSRPFACSFECSVRVGSGSAKAYLGADSLLDCSFGNVSDGGLGSKFLEFFAEYLGDLWIIASWWDRGVDADQSACEVDEVVSVGIDPAINVSD